jgi:hypothetical protein
MKSVLLGPDWAYRLSLRLRFGAGGGGGKRYKPGVHGDAAA